MSAENEVSKDKADNVIRLRDLVPFLKNLAVELFSFALKTYIVLLSWQILYSDALISIQPTLSSSCAVIFLLEARHFLLGKLFIENSGDKNVQS